MRVGHRTYLYIGKDHEEVINWKYSDNPALIILMMDRTEVRVRKERSDYEENGKLVRNWVRIVTFETTVEQAVKRLDSRGLGFENVVQWAAEALEGTAKEIKIELKSPPPPGTLWQSEFGSTLSALETNGYLEVRDLLVTWAYLRFVPKDAPVVIDISDMLFDDRKLPPMAYYERARESFYHRISTSSRIYSFAMNPQNPDAIAAVVKRVGRLSETALLARVVMPSLEREGYENARGIDHHGPWEFGSDSKVLRRQQMGKWTYHGVQAKAQRVDQGEAAHLSGQVEAAYRHVFNDDTDNTPKRLDGVMVFLARGATGPAFALLHGQHRPGFQVFYPEEIARLVLKHGLQGNI